MIKNRYVAILVTITILIGMSFGTIFTKLSFAKISPGIFVYLTIGIAMIAMMVYTFLIKKERIPTELLNRKVWSYIIQIGFFNFVTGTLGVYALNFMPATTNTYLTNFIGFITMGMSIFILKESPSIFQILGALIAFSGLRVFFPEPPQGGELLGILLILISISGVAYTNNIARKLAVETKNKISNNIISTLAIMIGAPISIAIYLIIEGLPPTMPSLATWGAILFVGLFNRAIGLTVWNLILRTLRSYEASILGASTVIWTSLLAVVFLKEQLHVNQLIGIGMMLVGLVLVQVRTGPVKNLLKRSKHVDTSPLEDIREE
jgi:drug/metabolite transporter (DMT)-like permease